MQALSEKKGKSPAKSQILTEFFNAKSFSTPFFNNIKRLSQEQEEAEERSWVSWERFKKEHGEKLALKMVEQNSVQRRPHKLLAEIPKEPGPGNSIKAPRNHCH